MMNFQVECEVSTGEKGEGVPIFFQDELPGEFSLGLIYESMLLKADSLCEDKRVEFHELKITFYPA